MVPGESLLLSFMLLFSHTIVGTVAQSTAPHRRQLYNQKPMLQKSSDHIIFACMVFSVTLLREHIKINVLRCTNANGTE